MNFSTLHSNIKAAIVAAGFTYVPAGRWVNVEFGYFPKALTGKSFSIKFLSMVDGAKLHNFSILNVIIEFVFAAKNDNYLTDFDDALNSIKTLKSITIPDYGKIITIPRGQFSTTYVNDFVIVTFNDIKIEVQ